MVKAMKRRDVEVALREYSCLLLRSTGDHDVYGCACGQHIFPLPRHKVISPGVVRDAIKRLVCLPEGWLQ